MRRLSDSAEMETLDNARRAYDNYSDSKHNRGYVREYDADLERNLENVVMMIADETWVPEGYTPKVIFNRKPLFRSRSQGGTHGSLRPFQCGAGNITLFDARVNAFFSFFSIVPHFICLASHRCYV